MVRTFLKVYMELGSYFLFLQEQIKDIIIITHLEPLGSVEKDSTMVKSMTARSEQKFHSIKLNYKPIQK